MGEIQAHPGSSHFILCYYSPDTPDIVICLILQVLVELASSRQYL